MRIEDLKTERVGLCVSGGLDSRTLTRKLTDSGVAVIAFSANLAQPDETDIEDIRRKMAPCGAELVMVDLREEMAEACFNALKAQAMYDGGYWNSTGLGRAVTVRGLLPAMKEKGCTVLAHGATGRGNDQMRFERYTNVLAPEMKVYAPWRDPTFLRDFPGRKQMAAYLTKCGLEAGGVEKKRYSTDANLAGLSHEAEDLESLETPCTIVEPVMCVWPHDAPEKPEPVTVSFQQGRACAINGQEMGPFELMLRANEIAGRNGIGLKNALENRIIGTKSRGVYEAPGMELLGRCLNVIYQATMDRRAGRLFRVLSRTVSDQIYDGRYFDPTTRAAMTAVNFLAAYATGTVQVALYKGQIYFRALRDCAASIYNEADSSMEESAGLNPVSSQGYAEIQSVEALSLRKAGQIGDHA